MPRLSRAEAQTRTRELLLTAARRLFVRDGYARTSLDGIAEAAGFSKGAVYSNFDGKEELFLDLLQAKLDGELANFAPLLQRKMSPAHLLALLRAHFEARTETLDFTSVAVEFMSQTERDSTMARKCAALYARQRIAISALVGRLFESAGLAPPVHAENIAAGIVSLTLGVAAQRRLAKRAVPVELWASLIHDYLADALAAAVPRQGGR